MAKTKKKKTTTSRPKQSPPKKRGPRGEGLAMEGTDAKFQRSYPGEDPKHDEFPEPVADIEQTLPVPKDEASKHKFPPPKRHPVFRKIWMAFIDNITGRENFKQGHLHSLEILCDLHVEYEDLRAFVRTHGRSYKSFGRSGQVWKFYPEVQQLNTVQAQIKEYMKMLGLILKKDHSTANPGGEKDEWA